MTCIVVTENTGRLMNKGIHRTPMDNVIKIFNYRVTIYHSERSEGLVELEGGGGHT